LTAVATACSARLISIGPDPDGRPRGHFRGH
jgi:hypothetical protein